LYRKVEREIHLYLVRSCYLRLEEIERTFLRVLSKDIADVVGAAFSEDFAQSLCSLQALSGESIGVFAIRLLGRFLAVADHVDDWS
jgi:hypothetical protein